MQLAMLSFGLILAILSSLQIESVSAMCKTLTPTLGAGTDGNYRQFTANIPDDAYFYQLYICYGSETFKRFGMRFTRDGHNSMHEIIDTGRDTGNGCSVAYTAGHQRYWNQVCYSSVWHGWLSGIRLKNTITGETLQIGTITDCKHPQALRGPLVGFETWSGVFTDKIKLMTDSCPCHILEATTSSYRLPDAELTATMPWQSISYTLTAIPEWPDISCSPLFQASQGALGAETQSQQVRVTPNSSVSVGTHSFTLVTTSVKTNNPGTIQVTVYGCERLAFSLNPAPMSVELTTTEAQTLVPHSFNTSVITTLHCPLSYSNTDWAGIVSFSGNVMYVHPPSDLTIGVYTKTIIVTVSGLGATPVSHYFYFQATIYGCERHSINVMPLASIIVEMADPDLPTADRSHTVTLTPSLAMAPEVRVLSCPLALSTQDGTDFLHFSGFSMTVKTSRADLVATHYLNVITTMTGYGATPISRTDALQIRIKPRCQLSQLIQVTQPSDMSTPMFSNVYQFLPPLYTHEHIDTWASYVQIWPDEVCILAYRIQDGDTTYISMVPSDEDLAPTLTDTLHLYPHILADEGTYTHYVIVYYHQSPDSVPPTQELRSTGPLEITVERICELSSFTNQPDVSTVLQVDYMINVDGARTWPFEIAYEPASCNYIKDYTITVDGISGNDPDWISVLISDVDASAQIQILSDAAADEGIYAIKVTSGINTTPKQVSSDAYEFVVSLADDKCSRTVFDAQTLTLAFEIDHDASPSVLVFPPYTYTTGPIYKNCGPAVYTLVHSYPGATFDPDSRTVAFETTLPPDVGTQELVILVELQDYPAYNPFVYRLETVTVTVTAACWATVLNYSAVSGLVYLSGRTELEYTLPVVQDSVSLEAASDGVSYCGARTFELVDVEGSDPSVLTFDPASETFTILSSVNDPAQWGFYTVTFGGTLDLYPDFNRQDFTFQFEITPDCEATIFSQAQTLALDPTYQLFSAQVDFAGYYDHSLAGLYSDICGPIQYILDPSGLPSQTYLTYDGATTLTLDPDLTSPRGPQNHTLRVQLRDFPLALLDVSFVADILACDIYGHYLDSYQGTSLEVTRSDLVLDYTYFIVGNTDQFEATFNDFTTAQGDSCEEIYTKKYVLKVDGVDVEESMPDWIETFDRATGDISVYTEDLTLAKTTFSLQLQSVLEPLNRPSDTTLQIHLTFEQHPCFVTVIDPPVLSDMAFTIDYLSVPLTQTFSQVTDLNGCGPYDMTLSQGHPDDAIIFDQDARSFTVWTEDGTYSWLDANSKTPATYTLSLTVTLTDYPQLAASIYATSTFTITIDSVCHQTYLQSKQLSPAIYFQEANVGTFVSLKAMDWVAQQRANSDFGLCGDRKYRYQWDEEEEQIYRLVGDRGKEQTVEVDGEVYREIVGTYVDLELKDDSTYPFNWRNRKYQITIQVSLADYPQALTREFTFDAFYLKKCENQVINQIFHSVINFYYVQTYEGGAPFTLSTQPVGSEIYSFLQLNGAQELADKELCGTVRLALLQGRDYSLYDMGDGQHMIDDTRLDHTPELTYEINLEIGLYYPSVTAQPLDSFDEASLKEGLWDPYPLVEGFYWKMSRIQFYHDGYPVPEQFTAQRQIWFGAFVAYIAAKTPNFVNNKPPEFTVIEPNCDLVYALVDNREEPFRMEIRAYDEDSPYIFVDVLYDYREVDFSLCYDCIISQGQSREGANEMASVFYLRGIPEFEWRTGRFTIQLQDGVSVVPFALRVIYISEATKAKLDLTKEGCVDFDQVAALAPQDSEIAQVAAEQKQIVAQAIESRDIVVEKEVVETDIQVNQTFEQVDFDIAAFFQQYFLLLSQKALTPGSSDFNWVMEQLQKLPYPVPLVIDVTNFGQVLIYFSREIAIPDTSSKVKALVTEIQADLLDGDHEGEQAFDQDFINLIEELSEAEEQQIDKSDPLELFQAIITTGDFLKLTIERSELTSATQGLSYFRGDAQAGQQAKVQQGQRKRRLLQEAATQPTPMNLSQEEEVANKRFNWTVTEMTGNYLYLKIHFESAQQISAFQPDLLRVDFDYPSVYLRAAEDPSKSNIAPSDLELPFQIKLLPEQLDEDTMQVIQEVARSISGTFQCASVVNLILSIAGRQSLQPLWGAINYLSLVIHIPLYNVKFPQIVSQMFEELIHFVTFDILESLAEVSPVFELNHDVSPTLPFGTLVVIPCDAASHGGGAGDDPDDESEESAVWCQGDDQTPLGSGTVEHTEGFAELGYDSSEPVGLLGTVNFYIGALVLKLLWFATPRRCLPRRFQKKADPEQLSAEAIRFAIETAFEMIICVGCVFWRRHESLLRLLDFPEKTMMDKFLIFYTASIAATLIVTAAFTSWATLYRSREAVNLAKTVRKIEYGRAVVKIRQDQQIIDYFNSLKGEDFSRSFDQKVIDRIRRQPSLTHAAKSAKLADKKSKLAKQMDKNRLLQELYDGINPASHMAHLYYFIYFFRRIALALIAFGLRDQPWLQVSLIVGLGLSKQIFLFSTKVFDSPEHNRSEKINDCFVYLSTVFALALLAAQQDARQTIGYWLVSTVLLSMALNLVRIFRESCIRLKRNALRWLVRKQSEARKWDQGQNDSRRVCKCDCPRCGNDWRPKPGPTKLGAKAFNLELTPCDLIEEAPVESVKVKENQIRRQSGFGVDELAGAGQTMGPNAPIQGTRISRRRRIWLGDQKLGARQQPLQRERIVQNYTSDFLEDQTFNISSAVLMDDTAEPSMAGLIDRSAEPSSPDSPAISTPLTALQIRSELLKELTLQDESGAASSQKHCRLRSWLHADTSLLKDNFDGALRPGEAKRMRIAEYPQLYMEFFAREEFVAASSPAEPDIPNRDTFNQNRRVRLSLADR